MTEEELKVIEARADAATEGPWTWRDGSDPYCDLGILAGASGEVCNFGCAEQYYPTEGTEPSPADAAFIASARTDVPALIAEVRRLQAEKTELAKSLTAWKAKWADLDWRLKGLEK